MGLLTGGFRRFALQKFDIHRTRSQPRLPAGNLLRSSRSEVLNLRSTTMNPETPERFVDADEAAIFLSLTRRRILDLARVGQLPAHPIGDGVRRVWRFRLSELVAAISSPQKNNLASQERARMVRGQRKINQVAKREH